MSSCASSLLPCLQTTRLKAKPGPYSVELPIVLKSGPTVMVTLKAVLVTPEIRASTETLAFGPVPTGKCKVGAQACSQQKGHTQLPAMPKLSSS